MVQNFKLQVLTLITRLSDRDTYASAATELESMARRIDSPSGILTFLYCVLSIGPNDKLPARRQCLHLISILSLLYPANLAPHLPKILNFITRRLRDPDSSIIRQQCASTSTSLAKNLTKVNFFNSFVKPLSEALFTEQEMNSHLGVAMCLSATIEASPDPEPEKLGKAMLAKLERLLHNEGYKWKVGGLTVLGSVIVVGGITGHNGLSELVGLLVGFLKSEDWSTRKASAEALRRLAVVEKEAMSEFKSGSMKIMESRRYDKVKAAREVMIQMIEAWKQLPDVSEEVSPPPRSIVSSGDDGDGEKDPPWRSKASASAGVRKRLNFERKTPTQTHLPLSKMTKNRALKKKSLSICGKDEASNPQRKMVNVKSEEIEDECKEYKMRKAEGKRGVVRKNSDENVMASVKEGSGSVKVNENEDMNRREGEELSSIRNQLNQIERQQSNLFSLVQSFMGTSQNGLRALESRVQGLEIALDDLALTTERLAEPARLSFCFIRRPKVTRARTSLDSHLRRRSVNFDTQRLRHGVITNPLAEIQVEPSSK